MKNFITKKLAAVKAAFKAEIEATTGIPQVDNLSIGIKIAIFFAFLVVVTTICYYVIFAV